MEVLDLQSELRNLRSSGQTLNLDERIQLENALARLHVDYKGQEFLFWGKINGR